MRPIDRLDGSDMLQVDTKDQRCLAPECAGIRLFISVCASVSSTLRLTYMQLGTIVCR